MRRPLHNQALLVAAGVGIIMFLYFLITETVSQTEYSGGNVSDVDSVSNSTYNTVDASNASSLPAVSNVPDTPTDHSILTTDDIIEQMKQGDFSSVEFRKSEREDLRKRMESIYESVEWVECDLNKNGLKGLVLQEDSGSYDGRIKEIEFIFALSNDKVICVQANSGTRINNFLSRNGNLVESYGSYGTTSVDTYKHYIFDDELNLKWLYTLEITSIADWYEEQMREYLEEVWDDEVQRERLLREWGSDAKSLDELIESYPERTTTGEYYKGYNRTGEDGVEETLTKQQFLDAFEEMTGLSFYEVNPEGIYMKDDLESSRGQSDREAEEMENSQ